MFNENVKLIIIFDKCTNLFDTDFKLKLHIQNLTMYFDFHNLSFHGI